MKEMFKNHKLLCVSFSLVLATLILVPTNLAIANYSKTFPCPDPVSVVIQGKGVAGDTQTKNSPSIENDMEPNTVYQVQSGDTLSAIAKKFHTTVEALTAYNQLDDANTIQAGMILRIPPADYVIPETETGKTEETSSTVPTEDSKPTETESSPESSETSNPDTSKNPADTSEPVQESEPGTETEKTSVPSESAPADGSAPAADVTNDGTE